MIVQYPSKTKEKTTGKVGPRPGWNNRFEVGDVVRTVGGGGAYNRGRIVEISNSEKYYTVNFGRRFPGLIREENLEPFDEKNPFSELPRSSNPPLLPFLK